jgi:hypothetical protein
MKLKDLNPLPGQVFERLDYTPKQVAMIDYSGRHATIVEILSRSMSCVLFAQVEGDWLLLQPAPVLGEAVNVDDVEAGERVLVRHNAGLPLAQGHGTGRNVIYLWCGSALVASVSDTIYRDPRPLPALPPEPSLREKLTDTLQKYGISPGPGQTYPLLNELEALLGGSHD